MEAAARDLLALEPDGLQLTPGNAPTPGFDAYAADLDVPTPTHHGFFARALRHPVWNERGDLLIDSDSMHPPKASAPAARTWWRRFTAGEYLCLCLETMYPGYLLGANAELETAMDLEQRLAVDVSHLFMQRTCGNLRDATLRRLFDYPHVAEVHVSANDGRRDAHRPIDSNTFGLTWARERAADGVPCVLECYMHRLDHRERRRQLALLRGRRP